MHGRCHVVLGDISSAINIYIITGYTDMRKSIDGLYAIILDQLKAEPDARSIYLFCGRRCDCIKFLLVSPTEWLFSINGLTLFRASTDGQEIVMRQKTLPGSNSTGLL